MAGNDNSWMSEQDIQKNVPIPYHFQLREIIRNEITAGRWDVGERLPSEREFCEAYNLSRTTVREALDALVSDGLLRREKGRGTFVAEPKIVERWLGTPDGFTESMMEEGYRLETHVLSAEVVPAPYKVEVELRLSSGEPVVVLDRLRLILDEPILLVTSYLPERLVPDLVHADLVKNSLYTTLRDSYGIEIAKAQRCMEAVAANEMEARLLKINRGAPLMLIESTAFLADGTPVEFFKARHRGDRTRFLVESYKSIVSHGKRSLQEIGAWLKN